MDLEIVLRLEQKIDQLLERKRHLEEECERLRDESRSLAEERQRFGVELDRILAKLDHLDQETP